MYQSLRQQLMEIITDDDLAFQPGGENPTLGALCREMGEVQQAYIDSFKTFTQDFAYRNQDPGLDSNVERLTDWFNALDRELKETIAGLSEDDLQQRQIDRGHGFTLPPRIQLHIYQEALLIFYGKVSVYLKAMEKALPKQWAEWIA
jgi:uncharacterized damage-inducible protein DinB